MSAISGLEIDPTADPSFILLKRDKRRRRRLLGYDVTLHEDMFEELRSIGQEALSYVQGLDQREYEPTAELEAGEECFVLPVDALPEPQHSDATQDDLEGVADLLAYVEDPTRLDLMSSADLGGEQFLAYGIILTDTQGSPVGFFRQDDPARPVKRGRVFGRFTDALRKVEEPPSVILHSDIDIVVTRQHIIALRKQAFQRLFADVDVALDEVPESVESVARLLGGQMPLTGVASETLRTVGSRRPSFALRLRRLGARARELAEAGLTTQEVRDSIVAVDGEPDDVLNSNNEFEFDEAQVGVFLDVLEGRWFKDSLGGEPRRADRYSRRSD